MRRRSEKIKKLIYFSLKYIVEVGVARPQAGPWQPECGKGNPRRPPRHVLHPELLIQWPDLLEVRPLSQKSGRAQRQVGPARKATLTMRVPCRRRPRSRRYGARATNSALASLKGIQSLTILCCLMHSATCSHPRRREVNRRCVVSIDTSILPRAPCACEHNDNVPACLLALAG